MSKKLTNNKELEFAKALLNILFSGYRGQASLELWNSELVLGSVDAETVLTISSVSVMRYLLNGKNLNSMAEAYLRGEIDYRGDIERVFDLIDHVQNRRFNKEEKWQLFKLLLAFKFNPAGIFELTQKRENPYVNSQGSIGHHYDVSNEFYKKVLDPEMIYSCAYYHDENDSLEQAQRNKLDHLCKKLILEPGETLLDIGCGWAGLALWAAKNYGVKVHGITLSKEQLALGKQRVKEAGLEKQITLELKDYRELPEKPIYDKIVSVGMFEHIGVKNFPTYFGTVQRLLKDGGLFMNHGITNDTGWKPVASAQFINKYIFPDGELARVSDVLLAMENQKFEILDVECLRQHYALTLRHWLQNLKQYETETISIAGIRIWRLWRLYMAGSAFFFNKGNLGLYQILAGKNRQAWPIPLTRAHLYRDH
jgi:cyclopropane-fatty-acyl-phospholipid synthase